MTRDSSRKKKDHLLPNDLLKTCVIFGANGSGKSTLIEGIGFIKDLISGNHPIRRPCRLKGMDPTTPTVIELIISSTASIPDIHIQNRIYDNKEMDEKPKFIKYHVEISGKSRDWTVTNEIIEEQNSSGSWNVVYSKGKSFATATSISKQNYSPVITGEYNIEDIGFDLFDLEEQLASISSRIEKLESNEKQIEFEIEKALCTNEEYRNQFIKNKNESSHFIIYSNDDSLTTMEKINKYIDDPAEKRRVLNLLSKRNEIEHDLKESRSELMRLSIKRNELAHMNKLDLDKKTHGTLFVLSDNNKKMMNESEKREIQAIAIIKDWLINTLAIIDTSHYMLNSLDSKSIEDLSHIITVFDVGITNLQWDTISEPDEIDRVMSEINSKDIEAIKNCYTHTSSNNKISCSTSFSTFRGLYKFEIQSGSVSLSKLVTIHTDGSKHELYQESDGTRRIIELSSILIPANRERVFVIDELDFRLHPLLTKKLLEMFYDSDSNDNKKQLIFTTHESELMDTRLFRLDEIWLTDRHNGGSTNIHCVANDNITFNGTLAEMYLYKKTLGGVPEINNHRDQEPF